MADMRKPVKIHSKDVSMEAEVIFFRLLAVNCNKKVPLECVLSYENAPVPLSLFTEEGIMLSCVKSDFMHKLDDLVPGDKISKINVCDAVIFDGHAVIQMLAPPSTSIKTTFKEMASRFCKYTMQTVQHMEPTDELRIHIIFDNYLESTIKKTTRVKRGDSDRGIVYHIQADISIPPNWKQFLTKGENKTKLAMFYTE